MTGSANLNRNVSLSETLFARSTCLRYCRYKYNFTISFTMLIESPSLSLEYYLFYELYFFSPCCSFRLKYNWQKNRELFQIHWIPLVFSVYPERV